MRKPAGKPSEFHIAVDLACLDHFRFDALFGRRHPMHDPFANRPRVTKRLDHFQKLRGQSHIAGDEPSFDEHHSLPGLSPLRIVILIDKNDINIRAVVQLLSPQFAQSQDAKPSGIPAVFRVLIYVVSFCLNHQRYTRSRLLRSCRCLGFWADFLQH